MNDIEYNIEENKSYDHKPIANVKVIGVGGGGTNMVNRIAREKEGLPITLIAANTDAQHLSESLADEKLQLGIKLTKGLGAGMKPEVGRDSAEESADDIAECLKGADIVFIAAGLGGGTGTGAAPIVARIAKEVGALAISIVTTPFKYEGKKRNKFAIIGLEGIKDNSDSIVVIPNSKLSSTLDRTVSYKDAFKIVDDVLFKAVYGICNLIFSKSANGINVDFQDLKTIMGYKGTALLGVGEDSGENSALEAVKRAIESPLFDDASIKGATGILVHFQFNDSYSFIDIENAMNYIYSSVNKDDEDDDIMFGTTIIDDLEENHVRVTIVATGFDRNVPTKEKQMENVTKTIQGLHEDVKNINIQSHESTNHTYDTNNFDSPSIYRQKNNN